MMATLAVHVAAVGADRSLVAGFSVSDRRACALAVERFALLLVKQHRAYSGFKYSGGFGALQQLQAQLEALRRDVACLVTRDDQYVEGRVAPDLECLVQSPNGSDGSGGGGGGGGA